MESTSRNHKTISYFLLVEENSNFTFWHKIMTRIEFESNFLFVFYSNFSRQRFQIWSWYDLDEKGGILELRIGNESQQHLFIITATLVLNPDV